MVQLEIKTCSIDGCYDNRLYHDRTWCAWHSRVYDMRFLARRKGKVDPGAQFFEDARRADMKCDICPQTMLLVKSGRDSKSKRLMTLQHERDGSFNLICISCNSAEGHWIGPGPWRDEYARNQNGEKWCPSCDKILPFDYFYLDERTRLGISSYCKHCDSIKRSIRYQKKKSLTQQPTIG